MSDEIIDVNAEEVPEDLAVIQVEEDKGPEEKLSDDGKNIPDPDYIDLPDENSKMAIEAARQQSAQLPQYPAEWQTGYTEDTKGFDDSVDPLKINVSFKEQEMKKIIKKYKRYLKSNLTEVKRLESE